MSDELRRFVKEHDLSVPETMVHILDAEREAHETLKMKYAMMEKFADDSVKRRAAETEEHAKQIADLKKKDVCVNCEGLLMSLKVSQQKYDQHIEHLKQRISYLEAQLQDQQPTICDEGITEEPDVSDVPLRMTWDMMPNKSEPEPEEGET